MNLTTNSKSRQKGKSIIRDIEEKITSGELKPGDTLLSVGELAQEYGVSEITANRAIAELAEMKFVKRVRGCGTFVSDEFDKVNEVGLGLHLSSSGIANPSNTMLEDYMEKIPLIFKERGHRVRLFTQQEVLNSDELDDILDSCQNLLVLRRYINDDTLRKFKEGKKPVVIILHEKADELPFHQVIVDWSTGIDEAVQHMIDRGFERVILAGRDSVFHDERKNQFKRILMQNGIDKEKIVDLSEKLLIGDQGRLAGQNLAKRILSEHDKNSFIVSTGGILSFGIMDVLMERGEVQNYPQLTFDDLEGEGLLPFDKPRISSIKNPRQRIIDKAVQMIVEESEGLKAECRLVKIPSSFIARESSLL